MTFEQFEREHLQGQSGEFIRLVRMGWNARVNYGDTEQTAVTSHEDGLTETTIEIPVMSGEHKMVPAMVHNSCPGLAVTMIPFGAFQVTHIRTGKKLCRLYQRASSALLSMSQWAMIADMKGKSWADLDQAGSARLIEDAKDDDVPFDDCTSTSKGVTKKATVGMWFHLKRMPMFDEFPREERDPYDMALQNLEQIEVRHER